MLGSCQRKKSIKPHVRTACINCKKAHLACDAERPCKRCISVGKTDSCYDIQHKKRGRPKLREKYASSLMNNGSTTTTTSYTSSTPKKQVSRLHTHSSSSHFQPMLPLTLPSSLPRSSPSPMTTQNQVRHSQLISSSPSIDSLTPFLTMSPPPSSFIMTKPTTTSKPEYDLTEALYKPMMTIFLTTEMCCARASDETMDFIGYHPQELAHRSLYDFISNPTDLRRIHHHLTQSHQQALHNNTIGGMSPPDTSSSHTTTNSSNNDYYHQMPPTTLLNIANGSKTFKIVLHFRAMDGREHMALDARFYYGGGLGADLCQPSTLDHLYIVCLLTKPTSSSISFSPGLAYSSNTSTAPPVSPLSLKSPSHSTDTTMLPDMPASSPISPPMNSSILSNDSGSAIQNAMADFSSLSYLSSSLSSVSSSYSSSSSSSTSSSYTPPLTSSSSVPLSSIPPSCALMTLTPPYSSNQTPSALEHDESSLYSWLDFAFSSNGSLPK